ncbi:MAG: hypothetical protein A4E30_00179 [Methanomassiliicoccales archaeon PtaB.Bin215]|nr:MAG: hypothetical protein A4E30_00179 [Methanomassiliicoccales archaeon PtaB.Bin215]
MGQGLLSLDLLRRGGIGDPLQLGLLLRQLLLQSFKFNALPAVGPADLADPGVQLGYLLANGHELRGDLVRLLGRFSQLLGDLVRLALAGAEADLAAFDRTADHGPGGFDELPAHGDQPNAAHQPSGLLQGVHDHRVTEHVPEGRAVLLVEADEIYGETRRLLLGQQRLAARSAVQHLVERQERGPPEVAPLQVVDGVGRHLVIVDHDGLHAAAGGDVQGHLVLGVHVRQFRDGPVYALHLPAVPRFQQRLHRPVVAAGDVDRRLLLGLQVVVFPRKIAHRLLQLVGHLGQLGLAVLLGMELLLQGLHGAAGVLALLAQLLHPPVQVLDLELGGLLVLTQALDLGQEVLGQALQPFLLQALGVQRLGHLPDVLVLLLDLLLQNG